MVEPSPIGGFRQVEEIGLLPRRFSGSLLCQAHVLVQVAILDRELSQRHAQPGVRVPRKLNHFRFGCSTIERRGNHEQEYA